MAENLDGSHRSRGTVDADGHKVELGQFVDHLGLLLIGMGRSLVGEGHHADEWQVGDASGRRDRDSQLVNPKESFEDKQIGAAASEDCRLLRMRRLDHRATLGLIEIEDSCQRRNRPRHQHISARDLPRLPRQLDRGGIDLFSEVADPATIHARPRAAKGSCLDQLGSGLDIGQMNVEHFLWMLVGGDIEARTLGKVLQQLRARAAIADDDVLRKSPFQLLDLHTASPRLTRCAQLSSSLPPSAAARNASRSPRPTTSTTGSGGWAPSAAIQ